jgi:hypothetical protein
MSATAHPPMGPMPGGLGQMPTRGPAAGPPPAPHEPAPLAPISFDRDPALRELLHPDVVIRPGLEYLACGLHNVPFAESQGFRIMPNQRSFSVRGVPCVLMTRGQAIPGARAESQLVQMMIDRSTDPRPTEAELASAPVAPAGVTEPEPALTVANDDTDPGPLPPAAQAALERATGRRK